MKTIGRGSFSKVFLVSKMDTNRFYAMKVIKKKALVNEVDKKRVLQEKKIFKLVDHPFIVKLHYSFQTHQKFYFILDLVNGDQMYEYMLRKFQLKEKAVKFYAAELVLALKCLHENDIIYRDLKPSNILIDSQGHIKIIDFGLSTFTDLNAVRQSV
jgi:serine/threonine protein kinase